MLKLFGIFRAVWFMRTCAKNI